jgi:peptidoglycan hydrolase-like protein with peptidoglycan-binding domain
VRFSAAQRYLIALGHYNGPVDGVAGPATRAAVQRFQASRGLAQTGTITPDVVAEMRRAI